VQTYVYPTLMTISPEADIPQRGPSACGTDP
jgi:hypothetical protein